jgi:hypothetical protein
MTWSVHPTWRGECKLYKLSLRTHGGKKSRPNRTRGQWGEPYGVTVHKRRGILITHSLVHSSCHAPSPWPHTILNVYAEALDGMHATSHPTQHVGCRPCCSPDQLTEAARFLCPSQPAASGGRHPAVGLAAAAPLLSQHTALSCSCFCCCCCGCHCCCCGCR